MTMAEILEPDQHLQRLLAPSVEEPWYRSFIQNVKEAINPPKLPPLEVTSKPVAVKDIWGLYGRKKSSGVMSLGVHAGVIVLLFTVASSKAVQQMVTKNITPIFTPDI